MVMSTWLPCGRIQSNHDYRTTSRFIVDIADLTRDSVYIMHTILIKTKKRLCTYQSPLTIEQ